MLERTFGETLGKEYYTYFGAFNSKRQANLAQYKRTQRYGYYKGNYYYLKSVDGNSYLWRSKEGILDLKVLRKLSEDELFSEVFVNASGIYLINEERGRVKLYDFNGDEKARVEINSKVKSLYICDNRVFYITYVADTEMDTAAWYDVETQTMHKICSMGRKYLGVNSRGERSFQLTTLNHIMANRKRVIMWLEFSYYSYPEDEDEIMEADTAGWYSFDFDTGKLISINATRVLPHYILKEPKMYFNEWLEVEKNSEWKSIAYFDMRKDIMWIKENECSNSNKTEIWEPRTIGKISENKLIDASGIESCEEKEAVRNFYCKKFKKI